MFPARKVFLILAVAVGVLLFAGFNVYIYRYSKRQTLSPGGIWKTVTTRGTGFPGFKPDTSPSVVPDAPPVVPDAPPVIPAKAGISAPTPTPPPTPTPTPTPTPIPTPTPRPTGPGEYACDPYGVCNRYSEASRKELCSVTFADSECLDQCGDKSKQCKK